MEVQDKTEFTSICNEIAKELEIKFDQVEVAYENKKYIYRCMFDIENGNYYHIAWGIDNPLEEALKKNRSIRDMIKDRICFLLKKEIKKDIEVRIIE